MSMYKERGYIKGRYVMRVIVCPINSTTVFFWRESNNKELEDKYINYSYSTSSEGVEKTFKMKNIRKDIKKRFNQHNVAE